MNEEEKVSAVVTETVMRANWMWLLVLGLLFLVLGFVGLGMTFGLTMVSVIFFGVLLIIGGVLQFFDMVKSHQWKGALWNALIAVLYMVGGCIVVYDPIMASAIITAFLAAILVFVGASRIIMAFMVKDNPSWVWLLIAGIATFILGVMIFAQWPVSGMWFIGLFIAIEMLINGWAFIMLAFAARRAQS